MNATLSQPRLKSCKSGLYKHNLPQKKVVGVDGKSRRRLKEKFWFEKSVNDRCDFRSDPSENKNLRRTNFSRGLSFGLGP